VDLVKRLYPYTKILPKPLIPIKGIPIVERIMMKFKADGCNEFLMLLNHRKEMIKAYLGEKSNEYNVSFYDELKPLGTAGGLSLIKDNIILEECSINEGEEFCILVQDYFIELSKSEDLSSDSGVVNRFEIFLGTPFNILDFINNEGYLYEAYKKAHNIGQR